MGLYMLQEEKGGDLSLGEADVHRRKLNFIKKKKSEIIMVDGRKIWDGSTPK